MSDSSVRRSESAREAFDFWHSFIATMRGTLGEIELARCEEASRLAAKQFLFAQPSGRRRPVAEHVGTGREHYESEIRTRFARLRAGPRGTDQFQDQAAVANAVLIDQQTYHLARSVNLLAYEVEPTSGCRM